MNGSRFLNAASAIAMTAGVLTSAGTMVLVSPVAAEAAVIRNISVRGAERTGAETVMSSLTIVPGKNFSNADIDQSIKRLYATGLFSDVRISVSGGTLVVVVNENQLINQVVFNGNRKIKDDKLRLLVKSQPLGPYSESLVEADLQALRRAYDEIGRSDVEITTQTVAVGDGRLNLAFVINEGGRTKIDQINFEGNNAYSDYRLRAVIATKESGLFSFITRRDIYSQDKLRADEEALRQFYYNHGYADFRVLSSDAVLDPATNTYVVTFQVDEGERYKFGPVTVESTVEGVDPAELQSLAETREGKTYRARDVQDSMSAISKRVASLGYPFARVTPRGNRDMANKTIAVDYVIDQGERAYVERIEIRGNTATRDYVIRREFDMAEGDAYNQERVAEAKRRLERLGYFSKVDIATQPGSAPDRVVLVVDVVDQSTGSFGIGAGYATGGEGFILEASIEEKNFLGRGQYIRVSASGGALTRNYSISFTEPYFLGYRLAAGFDLFKSSSSIMENYAYADQGFSLRVAAPITNDISTTFRYNYKELRYTSDSYYRLSQPYRRVVDGSPWVQSSVSNTVTYNTLDTATLPHEGILASLTQEIAGLGGDSRYYRISGRARGYYTISDEMDLIGSLSTSAGHVVSLDGKSLNVFDQFALDSNDIRGFADSGIGPRMRGDPIGGTTYMTASAEMTFPLPGVSQDSGFRGGFFVDAGTLFGNDVKVKEPTKGKLHGVGMDWRVATGASLIWASPFGPLRVDYAIPVMKQDHDIIQNLKFGISTAF
jgi:outer membrane protein insertion porin family